MAIHFPLSILLPSGFSVFFPHYLPSSLQFLALISSLLEGLYRNKIIIREYYLNICLMEYVYVFLISTLNIFHDIIKTLYSLEQKDVNSW